MSPSAVGLYTVKNSAALHVGRLVEVRIEAGYRDVGEVDHLFNLIKAVVAGAPASQRFVVVVDWRRLALMPSDVADHLLLRIKQSNPRTERTAALADPNSPVSVLQFLRVVRASDHPARKLFFEPEPLIGWLSELLTKTESARLREFLHGPSSVQMPSARAMRTPD